MDCVPVTCGVDFESSVPAHDSTLWRGGMNYMTLEFTGTLSAAPMAGEIMIQELLDGGAYGDDLSGSFTFEADGSSLAITETTEVLEHRTWYAIRNAGTWDGVGDFEIHLLLQVGDANEDGFVLPNDLSLINTMVPDLRGWSGVAYGHQRRHARSAERPEPCECQHSVLLGDQACRPLVDD